MPKRAVRLLRTPNDSFRRNAFYRLLESVTSAEAAEIAQVVAEEDRRGYDHETEWRTLFERWGELAPLDAMRFLETADTTLWSSGRSSQAAYSILQGWGEDDPQSALAYVEEHEGLRSDPDMSKSVIQAWSRTDADAASTFVLKAENAAYLPHIRLIAGTICRVSGQEGLEVWYERMKAMEPPGDFSHLDNTLVDRKLRSSPDALAEWVIRHAQNHTAAESDANVSSLAALASRQLVSQTPLLALEMNRQLADRASVEAVSECVRRCVDGDPDSVGNWLLQHEQDASADLIQEAYGNALLDVDPTAARAWIGSITDRSRRDEALRGLPAP